MTAIYEQGPRGTSTRTLAVSALVAVTVVAVILAATVLKARGSLTDSVTVTAELSDVGDGLPKSSDVKYHGVIVGSVRAVTPGIRGKRTVVRIALEPERAKGIPNTVTARVVPSNLFAVSSVQLLGDTGGSASRGLRGGDVITENRDNDTVQFQTALSKIRDIVASSAREPGDTTVGLLAAVTTATDRRGTDIVAAGAQLRRITREINAVMTPGGPSLLDGLTESVTALRKSAPDLLDALHSSVAPMQTVVAESSQLRTLLSAGITTTGTIDTAMRNNAAKLKQITREAAPIADVVARGGYSFTGTVVAIAEISDKWFTEFWPEGQQNARGKFRLQVTPHRLYTRADCPRYGTMEGDSCQTAPTVVTAPRYSGKKSAVTKGYKPVANMGGNVGSVGSQAEQQQLGTLVGGNPVTSTLLLGPVTRGADITVSPVSEGGTPR
ncbi:MCE family protein [Gordonia amarae]|uniref:Mce family protein n=2 Tax=Gordonia amarae TaxID=36821 RepID=G7GTS9_9ACTN|nr:MCE family protein [Gordonia amarae]MCS3877768.1 virulence factor Mce-like protein [Gordonia amarae]QHN16463.1 MCE family protein [Gordonia amarae]QHN21032.1 MCE family protein [Gordonia amarae]QHN29884.1 MCE family protein [Gordonia amarae]QHN38659.1 MCE family protein [Gordonia amarae]